MAKTAVQSQKLKLKDLTKRCKKLFLQHLSTWFLLNIVLILSIYKQLDKLKKIPTWIYFFTTFLNADIFLYFGCNEKLIVFSSTYNTFQHWSLDETGHTLDEGSAQTENTLSACHLQFLHVNYTVISKARSKLLQQRNINTSTQLPYLG